MTKPYYQDDSVTLYHGDCREVMSSLPADSVELLLTDPPYGIDYDSGNGGMGGIVGDDGLLDIEAVLGQALRCLKHHRHFYVFGPFDLSGLTTTHTTELIWDKGKFGLGDLTSPWGPSHERITFGTYSRFKSQSKYGGMATRLRKGSVLRVPKQNDARGATTHPTEKPVLLMRQMIESSTVIGETVFDPFAGVGSTLVAAQIETRRAIGIEIDERWCETAANRLSKLGMFGEAS